MVPVTWIERVKSSCVKNSGSEARLKSKTSRVVISGLLPVPRASEHRNRRIVQMIVCLQNWCMMEGFRFLDHWDHFWGRWDLYKLYI